MVNFMEIDKKRFNRSKKPTALLRSDAQEILNDITVSKVETLEYLEGGFSNTNYLVHFENKESPVVIRIGDLTSKQFNIEASISRKFRNIKAPLLLKKTTLGTKNVAVYKYYDGRLLSQVLETGKYCLKLAFNIGQALGNIHKVKFDSSGFFSEQIDIEIKTPNFGKELFDFTLSNFENPIAVNKMGNELNEEVINLIKMYEGRLVALENTNSLVHFDFNPKNILVCNEEVQVVLDWEYAASGCPLVDIANFFRFEEDYSVEFLSSFISGYESVSDDMPKDWRSTLKLLDLASMSNFITRSEELDASSKTAINVVRRTVKNFR